MERNTMKELLNGIIDLHIHAGPSVAKRSVDAIEMMQEAVDAGYRAAVIKDHYFPTMMSATMAQQHFGQEKTRMFGGIVLNNSVGLFNLNAVDAACAMGAKFVCMPTVSSKCHIDGHKGAFLGSGNTSAAENPVCYLNENGELDANLIQVLEYLAEKPEVILYTGHGTAPEVDALIRKATELGIQRILVNHPHFLVHATYEQMASWAKLGAFIELNAGVVKDIATLSEPVDISVVGKMIEAVPADRLVVDSDFGQKVNGSPVDGLYRFICALMKDLHVTQEQITAMTKTNPAWLLGL